MKYEEMLKIVKELPFDTKRTVCNEGGVEIFILRPSELSERFKSYDIKRNFQIFLKDGDREFKPNHLRVMIDLHLRSRSRPDLKEKLLSIVDNIFYKKDLDREIKGLQGEKFEHFLSPLKIICYLHQLFIIEQDYNYNRESKYNPPTLFYQGWVRASIDSGKQI